MIGFTVCVICVLIGINYHSEIAVFALLYVALLYNSSTKVQKDLMQFIFIYIIDTYKGPLQRNK